jgi:hypothetical protein
MARGKWDDCPTVQRLGRGEQSQEEVLEISTGVGMQSPGVEGGIP